MLVLGIFAAIGAYIAIGAFAASALVDSFTTNDDVYAAMALLFLWPIAVPMVGAMKVVEWLVKR